MQIITEGDGFHRRRYLEIDGQRVSWLHLLDYQAHLGGALVRVAGVGGVSTGRDQRMKGYARRLMEDTHRLMFDEGYDAALLFGIPRFYERFGYAPCMPDVTATVATRDIEGAAGEHDFSARPFEPDDFPEVFDLFNRNNAARPMCLVRPHGFIENWRHGSAFHVEPEVTVFEGPGGAFAGYAVCDAYPAPLVISEAELADPAALGVLMDVFAKKAVERREGDVAFQLPDDHPLIAAVRPLGCKVEKVYRKSGGAMARIINQETLLSKIASAAGEGGGSSGVLKAEIETELGRCKLSMPAGVDGHARLRLPAPTLLQLLAGFRTPGELAAADGIEIEGDGARLMRILSPEMEPHVYGPDRF